MAKKGFFSKENADKIHNVLVESLSKATSLYNSKTSGDWGLSDEFVEALSKISKACSSSSAGFTNVVTGLAIKAAYPELDTRYHQVQIEAPFNFRGISENVIYPWLSENEFEGAKSGWQTRTLERPKPYTLDYAENIARIKQPFLYCYHAPNVEWEDPLEALSFLMYDQIILREKKNIDLAIPKINNIYQIVDFYKEHFFFGYKGKGASRLPVLAIYSIYQAMMDQIDRYQGKKLLPLQSHSAADSQTGSFGDIEIVDENGNLFEAVEIKHDIKITNELVKDVLKKISKSSLERYYILTTYNNCAPDPEIMEILKKFYTQVGTQVVVNGVVPSLLYYLRLLKEPRTVFPYYIKLLQEDKDISHEHRIAWNTIITT